jgi:hypothetical protein
LADGYHFDESQEYILQPNEDVGWIQRVLLPSAKARNHPLFELFGLESRFDSTVCLVHLLEYILQSLADTAECDEYSETIERLWRNSQLAVVEDVANTSRTAVGQNVGNQVQAGNLNTRKSHRCTELADLFVQRRLVDRKRLVDALSDLLSAIGVLDAPHHGVFEHSPLGNQRSQQIFELIALFVAETAAARLLRSRRRRARRRRR